MTLLRLMAPTVCIESIGRKSEQCSFNLSPSDIEGTIYCAYGLLRRLLTGQRTRSVPILGHWTLMDLVKAALEPPTPISEELSTS
jgi:hypothetical protein